MTDLCFLKEHFQESSILALEAIFTRASRTTTQSDKKDLNLELLSVLQFEMSIGLTKWDVSPSSDNHIVVTGNICFLINIYGVLPILSNWLFLEGEMSIENINWIEEDKLVLFDVYYIVHQEIQKCICHYSKNSDEFTFFTPIQKCETNATVPKNTEKFDWCGEWL